MALIQMHPLLLFILLFSFIDKCVVKNEPLVKSVETISNICNRECKENEEEIIFTYGVIFDPCVSKNISKVAFLSALKSNSISMDVRLCFCKNSSVHDNHEKEYRKNTEAVVVLRGLKRHYCSKINIRGRRLSIKHRKLSLSGIHSYTNIAKVISCLVMNSIRKTNFLTTSLNYPLIDRPPLIRNLQCSHKSLSVMTPSIWTEPICHWELKVACRMRNNQRQDKSKEDFSNRILSTSLLAKAIIDEKNGRIRRSKTVKMSTTAATFDKGSVKTFSKPTKTFGSNENVSNYSKTVNGTPITESKGPRIQYKDTSGTNKLRHPNSRKRKAARSVTAVEGKIGILPCDSTALKKGDYPLLLIWLKEGEHTPLLSVDFHQKQEEPPQVGRDESSSLSKRSQIHLKEDADKSRSSLIRKGYNVPQGSLEIFPVMFTDRGIFRCRVDFLHSPTKNERVNLTVMAPPRYLDIEWENQGIWTPATGGKVGPLRENDPLKLLCRTGPAWPPAKVVWTERNNLSPPERDSQLSSEFVLEYGHKEVSLHPSEPSPLMTAVHFFEMDSLQRTDYLSRFWCHAANTNLSRPISRSVDVNLSLPVLSVDLDAIPTTTSNETIESQCTITGSYPPPVVRWTLGNSSLKYSNYWVSKDGNTTVVSIKFTPNEENDGDLLTCSAHNSKLASTEQPLWKKEERKLNVEYSPRVQARLGHSLNRSRIKEGDDVYFECDVKANPAPHIVYWTHNGNELQLSNGVFLANGTLVIQGVKTNHSGFYGCVVANLKGRAVSGLVKLRVKFAPKCKTTEVMQFSVAKQERVRIPCDVSAFPNDVAFNWKFNNTAEVSDVPADRYSANGTASILDYSPMNELDYGMLLCWARNEIGRQVKPCTFIVKVAGKPDPPHNCKVKTATISSLRVICIPGNDGGNSQVFHLQVYRDSLRGDAVTEVTNTKPDYLVVNLQPNTCYRLLATSANKRGESRYARRIVGCTAALTRPREETSAEATRERSLTNNFGFNMFVTLLLSGLALTLVLALMGIWACFQYKKRRRRRRDLDSNKTGSEDSSSTKENFEADGGETEKVEEAVSTC